MKHTKEQTYKAREAYDLYWDSYLNGDVKTLSSLLDDHYTQVGSVEGEVFFNKKDAVQFVVDTIDQIVGFLEMRNREIKSETVGQFILFHEFCDLYVLSEKDWVFYAKFRASSLMTENEEGWKMIHQHTSVPDSKAEEGDNIAIQTISKENLQLRDAIKRRTIELENKTNELEIEAALERIRSKSMAMRSSEELQEVAHLLFQELQKLGGNFWGAGIGLCKENTTEDEFWFAYENGMLPPVSIPNNVDPTHQAMYEGWLEKKGYLAQVKEGAELKAHYDYMLSVPSVKPFFENILESGLSFPSWQTWHAAYFSHGYILSITLEDYPKPQVFERFAKVFDQAYTRFLDLQKAEEQTREAEIELALERVRARTMAMHSSSELLEVATVLFQQVKSLGVPQWNCGFNIWDKGDSEFTYYPGSPDGIIFPSPCKIPLEEHPIFRKFNESRNRGDELLIYEKDGEIQADHYAYMLSLPGVGDLLQSMLDAGFELPTFQIDHIANFAYGNLIFITYQHYPEMHEVFKRFAKVFEQTYTRFLDLQKAEAQAREAQIEAALEKVRSRSLAMHNSKELNEVVKVLFEKLNELQIPSTAVAIQTFTDDSKDMDVFVCGDVGTGLVINQYHLPYFDHPIINDYIHAHEESLAFYKGEYSVAEKDSFYDVVLKLPELTNLPSEVERMIRKSSHYSVKMAPSGKSIVAVNDFVGKPLSEPDIAILKRFSKVFDQAYTRFLDLQKAEAQSREAQIEAALERIRSRSLAMYKTDDLREVVAVLFEQMQGLSVDMGFASVSIFIFEEGSRNITQWIPTSAGVSTLSIPYFDHPISADLFDAKENGADYFAKIYSLEEKNTWLEAGFELTDYKDLPDDFKSSLLEAPGYAISITVAKNSGICIPSFVGTLPSSDDVAIMKRVGKVFEQAYIRFRDLQKAEAQARESQIEAALEKVRNRSLAMHKSDELNEVVSIVFEKLKELQIPATAVGIGVAIEGSKDLDSFVCGQNEAGLVITNYRLPYFDNQIPKDFYNALEKQLDFFVGHYSKAEKDAFYNYLIEHTAEFKHLPEDILRMIFDSPTYSITSVAVRNAVFNINDFEGKTLAESEIDIIKRFAKVFDQAYTRFLDLKRAEAQTREAQVEASLERIRAKAMAMHHSDELDEVLAVLCEQFDTLGIFPMSTHMTVLDIPNNKFTFRETGKFGNRSFGEQTVALNAMDTWKDMVESWKNADPFSVNRLHFPKETLPQVWEVFHDSFSSMPEGSKITPDDYPDGIYHTAGKHPFGYIGMNQVHPATEAEEQIVIKFASEFGRAYQRFLDLQKAEAQAREAQIEAALERIRGQVASMRESTELLEIVVTMRTEFVALGHEAHYFWHMRWLPDTYEKAMTSGDGTQIGMVMSLPRRIHGDIKMVADWEKGSEPILVLAMETETAVDYVDKMITWGDFEQVDPQAPTLDDIRHIQGLTFVMARTTHGEIGFSLPGSVPNPPQEDMDTLVRFAKVFDLAYKRFEDLKKAEYQARETQIELALERVRSRSMAMQNSSELKYVIQVVYQQFVALEIPIEHTGFIMDYKDREDMNIWLADSNQFQSEITFPYFDSPHWNSFLEAKAKGENFFTNLLDFETKNKFYRGLFEFIPELPKDKQEFYFSKDGLSISTVLLDNVGLYIENYTTTPFTTEENQVLIRFGKVFQQTYTRFLDLQKAEAQTRNAQIDLAVERVRAKALAMHNSSQILEVVAELKNEMLGLEIPGVVAATIYLKEEAGFIRMWDLTSVQDTSDGFQVTLDLKFKLADTDPGFFVRKIWNNTERYFVEKQEKDDLAITLEWLRQYNAEEADNVSEFFATNPLEYVLHPTVKLANGKMSLDILNTTPPAEMESIMVKMGAAFDLAYKRFLDLQKAESQAREAQIELGLERVRARAMAMQNTDELSDLVGNLLSELTKLDFSLTFCIINIINEADQSNIVWAANPEEGKAPESYYMKFEDYPFHHAMMQEWKAQTPKFVYVIEGKEKEIYDDYLYVDTEFSRFPEEVQKANRALDKYVASFVFSQFGGLQTVGNEYLSDDSLDILYRFGKVFDLTYTRFNDLQKAEARARESQIETALERVRSRTMGMQQSEELGEVATVLFNEMNGLVDDLWTCGFVLCEENRKEDEWWLSMDSGFTRGFFLPNVGDYAHETLYEGWEKGEPFRSVELEGKILSDHYEWLMEVPIAKQIFADMEASGISRPEWQKLHAAYFKTGYLVIITEVPCDEEEIFKRFAQVFDLTYTRFLDLQQKEEQGKKLVEEKLRLELTLKDLQVTQAQLIQAEKMASLGELTAGIAHEIQNPLNFVNNFSEVSGELIDEMNEEIEKGDFEEVKFIANDLKENLSKINHHGKRADAIVKGMLEHSRANKGEKAPTDLNALADEFVRLSYHGLRAKDKSFNADFKLELDPDLPKVNVVASDIGRVILNLVNNAFYACAERSRSTVYEKSKSSPQDYKPEVIIKSKKTEKGIELSVQDNGSGIPDSIKEKIFQPFFTTKPTGAGTGLGLSLSYDIVKAHGGELLVKSKEGKGLTFDESGTEFKLIIPLA